MANLVRCDMPDKTYRFQPFKISDYRDFLLIRNDMNHHDQNKQEEILNDILDDYFPGYPKTWQQYFFLKVYTSSIGKSVIPIVFQCPHCGKKIDHFFDISQKPLTNPVLTLSETTSLELEFPETNEQNLSKQVLNNIKYVEHDGQRYDWDKLNDETKEDLFDLISVENLNDLLKSMKPIYLELKTKKCCDSSTHIVYDDLLSIFKLLVNPEEVFTFYEINHILAKNNYDITSIMNMYPIERTVALSIIEKEKAKEKARRDK